MANINIVKGYHETIFDYPEISEGKSIFNDQELENEKNMAISTIYHIALTLSYTNDRDYLNHKGKCLFNSLYFLSQNDVSGTLTCLKSILSKNQVNGSSRIELPLKLTTLNLDVLYMDYFQVLSIIALNYIPTSVKYVNEDTRTLLHNIFLMILKLLDIKNPQCIAITKTAYNIFKKYLKNSDFRTIEHEIQYVTSTATTMAFYTKANEYLDHISEILVKSWSDEKKKLEFDHLCFLNTWDNYDCQILIYLLNFWPETIPLLPKLRRLAKRISLTLTQRNVSHNAIRLLNSSYRHLDFNTYKYFFVPALLKMAPVDITEKTTYIKNVLIECASLAVKHFGVIALEEAVLIKDDGTYRALILFCCIKQGLLDVHQYQTDIKLILGSPNSIIQYYGIKILCTCNNKRFELKQWQLQLVTLFLKNTLFENQSESNFLNDLHFLFSHICVTANDVIINKGNELILKRYVNFVKNIYKLCMENLISRCPVRLNISAQVFNLLNSVFVKYSSFLRTKYMVTENYEQKQSPIFRYFDANNYWGFGNLETWKILCLEFVNCPKLHPEVSDLITKWGVIYTSNDISDTNKLIFNLGKSLLNTQTDFNSIEKGCHCIKIVLRNTDGYEKYYNPIISCIRENLIGKSIKLDSYDDLIHTLLNNYPIFGWTSCLCYLLKHENLSVNLDILFCNSIFDYCENMINKILISSTLEIPNVFGPVRKIIEQMLIVCLDIILTLLNVTEINEELVMRAILVANGIMASNMKNPVTTAAVAISKICANILKVKNGKYEALVIKFLHHTLNDARLTLDCPISKIRRCPQHRLTIHAIILADPRPGHPLLIYSMDFLLQIISDDEINCGAMTSALHTIEILLSENRLRLITRPYITPITVHCINKFSSHEWSIKNAAIQVFQSIANRILGQQSTLLQRRHAIEDVFTVFPDLSRYFLSVLQDPNIDKSPEKAIAILALFSESWAKLNLFLNNEIIRLKHCFLATFFSLITSSGSTIIGTFAAKAFTSLSLHAAIPCTISEILQWFCKFYSSLSKTVFSVILQLVQLLHERFKRFKHVSYYKIGIKIIDSAYQQLIPVLEHLNRQYEYSLFPLLKITVNSVCVIEHSFSYHLQQDTYKSRLWLQNNISYALKNIDIKKYPCLLRTFLEQPLPLSLLLECAWSVFDRQHELIIQDSLKTEILLIILNTFLNLKDTCKYLLSVFSNVIHLLLENSNFVLSREVLNRFTINHHNGTNIYFLSVFISLLSQQPSNVSINSDKILVKEALQIYSKACEAGDFDLRFHASSTLKNLFQVVEVGERPEVLKLAFILLLDQDFAVSFEINKFVSIIFVVECSNRHSTLETLLSFSKLRHLFGNDSPAVFNFLTDLTVFVRNLDDLFEYSGEFYMKQNKDVCFHKVYLMKLLVMTLCTNLNHLE